jgi:ferredoxin
MEEQVNRDWVVKVQVDSNTCVGHGRCYELAPEVFGEDDRGHCRILRETIGPELEKKARLGLSNCPEGAISIEKD